MRTKLLSTSLGLSWVVMTGCGGVTSEALPLDAQPADMTAAGSAQEPGDGGAPPVTPTMASSDAPEPEAVPEAQPVPEGDGGAGAAADSPPGLEQAPSFCGGRATSVVWVAANLDANSVAINTAAIVGPPHIDAHPFDPQAPGDTANCSTSITIYDSLGVGHSMEIHFRASDAEVRTWDYHLLLPGAEVVGGIPDGYCEVGGGALRFAGNGELSSDSGSPVTIAFRNAPISSTLEVDFAGRMGATEIAEGMTNVPGHSTVYGQFQDGYAASWGSDLCAPPRRE